MSVVQVAPGETGEVRGGVIAYLQVDGAVKAADYYARAFGAREVARAPLDEKGRTMHLHLYINEGSLMLCDVYEEHGHPLEKPGGMTLTLNVTDPDMWWERATKAEGTVVEVELQEMFWGSRWGQVRDPFGFSWAITG
ncbi:glyoxalase [Nitratireductor aestuarii]|uniref:Glyoxalase n=1 Tax=Nitratireductor aestuarii TaxID=1735103 RepID=A0A916W677_9HYPH|nr:VOC family protein [Nitratireductor aestuarii]GGA70251.1 glyoxalase [Nitratireductor aestuarii]